MRFELERSKYKIEQYGIKIQTLAEIDLKIQRCGSQASSGG